MGNLHGRSCSQCEFVDYEIDSRYGEFDYYLECRRNAPTNNKRRFPKVDRSDWCGEFEESESILPHIKETKKSWEEIKNSTDDDEADNS